MIFLYFYSIPSEKMPYVASERLCLLAKPRSRDDYFHSRRGFNLNLITS